MPAIDLDQHIDNGDYYLQRVEKARIVGDQLIGRCPFHEDSHESFGANLKTGQWLCRAGCGRGNVTSFHAKMNDMSNAEAYQDLLRIHGLSGNGNGAGPKKDGGKPGKKAGRKAENKAAPAAPPKDEKILPAELAERFRPMSERLKAYLVQKRGWSEEVIERFRIGFLKDKDRPAYTIPIYDEAGRLVNVRTYAPGTDPKIKSWTTGSKKKGNFVGYGEGRLYPFPILQEARESGRPIILCEGEPDMLCGISHGLLCVTQTTGAETWKDEFNAAFKGLDVVIAYDCDQAGKRGTARVAKHLPHFARSVESIRWPEWMPCKEKDGEDLTDWFMKYGKTAGEFLELPREKHEPQAPGGGGAADGAVGKGVSERLAELNRKHAVIMIGGKCVVMNECIEPIFGRHELTFSSVSDFRNFYDNERYVQSSESRPTGIGRIWLSSRERRQYQGIVFAPGEDVPDHYNLWRGFAVEPKKGDWSLYRDHVFNVIARGNEEIFFYLMAWMAHTVQQPGGERPGTSIVLRGEQGSGKGLFVTQFGRLFGSHFLHITNQHQITGRFNNHLAGAIVVFVDEGMWAGDKQAEGILKGMITEDLIAVEPKGKDVFMVANHVRLLIASNNSWVVPAGLEERRFFVLDVSEDHRQDAKYFRPVFEQMDAGGREALLYDLLELDTSDVDLRKFPRTQALADQIIHSMSTVQKFWLERLRAGALYADSDEWNAYIPTKTLYDQYLEFCRAVGDRYPSIDIHFGRDLRKLCPAMARGRRFIDSKREWVLNFPGLWECRDQFEKVLRMPIDWNEDRYGEGARPRDGPGERAGVG